MGLRRLVTRIFRRVKPVLPHLGMTVLGVVVGAVAARYGVDLVSLVRDGLLVLATAPVHEGLHRLFLRGRFRLSRFGIDLIVERPVSRRRYIAGALAPQALTALFLAAGHPFAAVIHGTIASAGDYIDVARTLRSSRGVGPAPRRRAGEAAGSVLEADA